MKISTSTLLRRNPVGPKIYEALGPPIPLSAEENERLQELLQQELINGLLCLRRAGAHIDFLACTNTIRVVWKDIEVRYDNDISGVFVNGMNIADQVLAWRAAASAGNYPHISVDFGGLPWTINEELTPTEQRQRIEEMHKDVLETGRQQNSSSDASDADDR